MEHKRTREKYWIIWDAAQTDPIYRAMLLRLRRMDKAYEQVLQTLPEQDRDTIIDFLSLCEEMSGRMLEIACEKMDFIQ